jgi:hypothetical protein
MLSIVRAVHARRFDGVHEFRDAHLYCIVICQSVDARPDFVAVRRRCVDCVMDFRPQHCSRVAPNRSAVARVTVS